ncbi:hypothetical protein M5K25_022064 [Dendrobium thyrsiflorum]|uniref:Uncharacterized protein n=1 Tax=Dendrobium thyrsiflorum TaxID=117978 RepID=A0ABD0U5R1_DENTH
MYQTLITNPYLSFVQMELQNTPMTVQLGQGARIQLANAVINTGSSGATIQFGSVDFPDVVARTAATSAYGTDFERPARRPHSAETSTRSAHLSAPRVTVTQEPRRRISVFERISQPEAPATKRIVTGGRIFVVTANTTTLPTGSPASGNNNVETSSSGGRLTRRQRRKRIAELRAQQQFSTHPSNVPAQELEATIPTQNGFSNLKWVKRNSSTGELKKSFWKQRREVPTPPKKKEPESLSARLYRVLKTVKERGLTKRKIQRPLRVETRRAPPKERLSVTTRIRERRYTPRGEHRGVTPEHRVQGSTAERSRHKGKQIWRPRPHRDEERKEREIDLGVTSGVASRRSAPNSRDRRRWVQKKTHDDACYNCRHLGESSKGSRCSPTPPKEEVNFDRSPRVEEILLPNKEPEIQWRRRSEIRLLGEGENMEENMKEEYLKDEDYMEDEQEEMNDTINMEVVYMVRHVEVEYDDGEDDGDWQPHPQQEYQHQHEAGSIADGGNRSQGEQEADEVEENHSDDENITLANIRRQMRRQMRAKDREISQLNEKMTGMMAQMTAMMRMMQRTAVAGAIPNPPADPPNLRMPQVSGVRGARRGEADSTFFSRTDKGKQVVYNVDKGKQPMQYEEKPKQVYNPNPQPKLILGGNDKPQNFQGGGERPRQNMGTGDRTFPSLKDKMNKEYSFKRESVAKLFRQAVKAGLELPECKRPEESKQTGDPNYCPYHRVVSHPIEDCYIFKDWLERKYQKGELTLSDNVLSHPRKESTRVVTSSSVPPIDDRKNDKKLIQEEQWETAVSKKTTKMLKQLEGVPGVKWKSPTEPVLNLKRLPKVQASTSKQHLSQASPSKPRKPKFFKKKTKLKKPKEKKTVTQKVIDSLDEYYQTVRQPIKLADFMSELKIGETEEDSDADFLPAEVCRVISVVPSTSVNGKYVKKEAHESCMMVLPMDCSSEEDLYFPEEDESDPDIASQMEHAVQQLKQRAERKPVGRKKALPTLPKSVTIPKERKHVPHLGSDTDENDITPTKSQRVSRSKTKGRKEVEYSNDDYDYDSIYTNTVHGVFSRRIDNLSISDSVLVVTRIPLQCFREIIPRRVHDVEELTTFYVPPLREKGGPASLFYSSGRLDEDTNRDWFCNLVDSGELVPTRFPSQKEDFRDYVPEQIEPEQLEVFQQPELKLPCLVRLNIIRSALAPTANSACSQGLLRPLFDFPHRVRYKIFYPKTPFSALAAHRKTNSCTLFPSVVGREPGAVPSARRMELQNTPMTVQLGQGARIQLANAVINTGSSGATIQFGSVDFPDVVARTAATSAYGTDFERPARRPHSAETSTRSAHLSAPRVTVTQEPRRRISVFERISQPEAPATKRIVTGGRIFVVTANTTTLPTGSPASGNNNVETSSSGGRLTRRQRRKRIAELRAQQQFSTHPSNVPAQELEATIPTQNGFSNLKWVKRNSSTGELKKSFWKQRREVPTPPKKKEPESLSARLYRVLKTVKERGLTKRKIQRPLRVETRRAPPKERLSVTTRIRERRYTPRGEHRGVTPEHRVQGSTAERSRHKGKQIWRPRPHRDEERKEREIDLGVTSGVASRRSAPNSRDRRRWVQKKTHDDACYNCRHLGESSKGSRCSPTPPKEEVNFNRSPRVEEILLPNKEPEIQWRRRSEIRLLGEGENMEENMKEEYLKDEDYMEDEQEEMNDTINMEVVYMVRHVEVEYDDGEDDGDWQPHPQQEYQHQHEAGSIADGGNRSQGEQEADEVEENHSDDENITLANIRRQMRRQMRAKDREISQLNEKMTGMMAQMTAMMRMMQRTAVAGAIPNPPADPPNLRMPQVSGVRGARRGEADSTFFSRTDKGKQVVYNVDKGKQPMQYEEKPKQVYNPNPQPKLILGGNDKPRNFQGGGERPRQNMGIGDRTFPSLKDKMNKEYSFKRESVAKLFRQAVKAGLELPECKRPEESKQTGDPNYCPYHRVVSHPIEDCYIFKDWLERKYQKGELTLSDNVLSHPRKESTRVVTSSSVPPIDDRKNDKKLIQEEQWETAVSKKTTKMLKQLEGVPGVKWKSPTEPVLNLKRLPKVQASTSKQHLSQASPSKPRKPKFFKKKTKLKKPKEKKTVTQKVIDSLDEYYQTVRQPIKLADFMSELKIGETEEDSDANFLPAEVCRVISVVPSTSVNGKYVKKEAHESCMMVLPMDCSSEEDLYFPEEDESDPDIASQMEHVNLGGSDTDENDITPTKSQRVSRSKTKGRKEVEYSNDDYDYDSIYTNTVHGVFSRRIDNLSISDSVLVVTRIPLQCFREIIPRRVHDVEELTTFYVPPLREKGGPASLFYSSGRLDEDTNRDWFCNLVDSGELVPTRFPSSHRFQSTRHQELLIGSHMNLEIPYES